MKKIQLLTIMVLTGAVAFGAQAVAHKAKVNFQESLTRVESSGSIADLVIDSKEAIHGLQFDINYNPAEIKAIVPQELSGFEVKYNELSEGVVRGLIFSLQGLSLPENLTFEFINVEGFDGTSTIEFKEIILAAPLARINPADAVDILKREHTKRSTETKRRRIGRMQLV